MLRTLQDLFDRHIRPTAESGTGADTEHALQLAAAALLMEISRADDAISSDERGSVEDALARTFDLSSEEIDELIAFAEQESDHAVSLHQFTHELNRQFDAARKQELVRLLWKVAYADGALDKYEEHLIRRLADLLHVPHAQFIRAKHEAAPDGT